jgi:hypothetical protein
MVRGLDIPRITGQLSTTDGFLYPFRRRYQSAHGSPVTISPSRNQDPIMPKASREAVPRHPLNSWSIGREDSVPLTPGVTPPQVDEEGRAVDFTVPVPVRTNQGGGGGTSWAMVSSVPLQGLISQPWPSRTSRMPRHLGRLGSCPPSLDLPIPTHPTAGPTYPPQSSPSP